MICWNVKDNLLFATPYACQRRTNIKRGQNLRARLNKERRTTYTKRHLSFFSLLLKMSVRLRLITLTVEFLQKKKNIRNVLNKHIESPFITIRFYLLKGLRSELSREEYALNCTAVIINYQSRHHLLRLPGNIN